MTECRMEYAMKNMTLANITKVCDGTFFGNTEALEDEVTGVVIDSRLVEEGNLFVAIKGERVDGHSFIPAVFEKGAKCVLSEQKLEQPAGPYILVASCEKALKQLSAFYRRALDIKVVGITGSVGKTSTKEMIASVLTQKYNVHKTEGNYNNEIGLPLTIFKIRDTHEVAVLEMGISDFDEMHRLAEMAHPDVMVITNIGLCHLENLKTRDGILTAKTESFEHLTECGSVVLNGDDDKLCEKTEVNGIKTVFYGIGKEPKIVEEEGTTKRLAEKDIFATNVEAIGLTGTCASIHTPEGSFEVEIPIAGEHNVYNALAAVGVGRKLGLNNEEMKRGIETVQTIAGRSNLIHKNGMTIIDDCYNANPVSMMASIDVLSKASGRKVAVLGDMGELGDTEVELHGKVGKHFAGKSIDVLYCTGVLSENIAKAVKECSPQTKVSYFEEKEALIEALLLDAMAGDTILIKASHFMNFTEIVKAF